MKFLYDNFWLPFFGKILTKFVFLIEGKSVNSNIDEDSVNKIS